VTSVVRRGGCLVCLLGKGSGGVARCGCRSRDESVFESVVDPAGLRALATPSARARCARVEPLRCALQLVLHARWLGRGGLGSPKGLWKLIDGVTRLDLFIERRPHGDGMETPLQIVKETSNA